MAKCKALTGSAVKGLTIITHQPLTIHNILTVLQHPSAPGTSIPIEGGHSLCPAKNRRGKKNQQVYFFH